MEEIRGVRHPMCEQVLAVQGLQQKFVFHAVHMQCLAVARHALA